MASINPLREAAEILESMAIGAVTLASARTTASPYSAGSPQEQKLIVEQMQERKSYIYDAGQNVQIAEVFHSLADRAEKAADTEPVEIDRGEVLASAVSDAAAEYSERLSRIQDFVFGFKDVPGAEQWWQSIGKPIVKMAAGDKL